MELVNDIVQGILSTPKNILYSTNKFYIICVLLATVIGLGFVGNRIDKQNHPTVAPLGYDTTALGPFSNDQIKSMWESYVAADQEYVYPSTSYWQDKEFQYVARQVVFGGNQKQNADPIFGNGPGGFNVAFNTLTSGLYVVIVTKTITDATNSHAVLMKVVSSINTNPNPTDVNNQITYPNTYKLSYIDNIANNYSNNTKWYY